MLQCVAVCCSAYGELSHEGVDRPHWACCSGQIAVRCSVLQRVAVCMENLSTGERASHISKGSESCCSGLQYVAMFCSVTFCCSASHVPKGSEIRCGVLQHSAIYCSVMQCAAVCCSASHIPKGSESCCSVMQYVAACCSVTFCCSAPQIVKGSESCCSVLQYVAACCSVLHSVAVPPTFPRAVNPVAVCYNMLQCIAACCSLLQCVTFCCSASHIVKGSESCCNELQ